MSAAGIIIPNRVASTTYGYRFIPFRYALFARGSVARQIGVSQPVVCDYERGNLRLHGELLIVLARILEVSVDEILGLAPLQPRGPIKDRRFQRRLEQIDRLTRPDREALLRTIDAFLSKGR